METKRIYVGGLYKDAVEKDVSALFSKFGKVESVELKKRADNEFIFGYVNINAAADELAKCFKRLNGTFWKGKRLKLELARESFLSRLQRERAQNKGSSLTPQHNQFRAAARGPNSRNPAAPARSPAPHQLREYRILDNVLAKQRASVKNGVASKADAVVDFTHDDSGFDVEPITGKTKRSLQESNSCSRDTARSGVIPILKSAKKEKKRYDSESDYDDEVPRKGALPMFGGIGEIFNVDANKNTQLSLETPAQDSEMEPSARKKKSKRKREGSDVTSEVDTPERKQKSGSSHQAGDFLSRLEVFSSVWGDDGGGSGRLSGPRHSPSKTIHESPLTYSKMKTERLRNSKNESPDNRAVVETGLNELKPDCYESKSIRQAYTNEINSFSQENHEARPEYAVTPQRSAEAMQGDNQRRIESLKQKQETFKQQKLALQIALSSKADEVRPNKKIVFDDPETADSESLAHTGAKTTTSSSENLRRQSSSITAATEKQKSEGMKLFDEEEEEEEDHDDFRIRPQYEGKKGQKLQALQSTYGADARFTLDERFADAEPAAVEEDGTNEEEEDVTQEHAAQLDILQSVLGHSVEKVKKDKGNKMQSTPGLVRYDPSLESHSQYQLQQKKHQQFDAQLEEDSFGAAGASASATAAPKVSDDRYHEVDPSLGDLFMSKSGSSAGFSLLEMMGRVPKTASEDGAESGEHYSSTDIKSRSKLNPLDSTSNNPFQYDSSSSSEDETEIDGSTAPKKVAIGGTAGGWSQTKKFFLAKGDARLQEGKDFVSSALSVDKLQELAKQRRPELLELFRTQKHSRLRELRKARGRGRRPFAAR